MKTILLAALTLLLGNAGYSQTQQYNCTKKTVHNTTTHRVARKTKKASQTTVLAQCPSYLGAGNNCIYDKDGNLKYMLESSYTGNYPTTATEENIISIMPAKKLQVTSTAFTNYGPMPSKYTCEGQQASPPLNVADIPQDTRSLAIVMYDPDANGHNSETYWLIWDIDTSSNIPENFVNNHESLNLAGEYGYKGVCPIGGTHYYHFIVYALDTRFTGNRHTTRGQLEHAMRGHVLARGELVGRYEKL